MRAAQKTACTCRRREAGVGRLNDAVVSRVRENFHLVTREARQVQMQECFPASSVGKSNMGKKKKEKKRSSPERLPSGIHRLGAAPLRYELGPNSSHLLDR